MHIRYFHLPCMEIDLLKCGKKTSRELQRYSIFAERGYFYKVHIKRNPPWHRTVSLRLKEGYGFEKRWIYLKSQPRYSKCNLNMKGDFQNWGFFAEIRCFVFCLKWPHLIDLSLSEKRNLYARIILFVHSETPQLKLKKCRQHPPRFWVTRVGIWAGLKAG